MEYVAFGKTDARVSRLGFGGAPAGLKNYLDPYDPDDGAQRGRVVAAIERAYDLGVTYFDTAPGYGQGTSEAIFGEALSGRGDAFVATKVSQGDGDHVRRSVDESLQRLRRDRLDLVQIHGGSYRPAAVDAILGSGGMADALDDLRGEGIIRFTGFTAEDNNDGVYRLIRSGRFDVMQICYNLMFQHPYEPSRPFGSLLEADSAGMGTVTMRTLTSGTLQRWVQMVNPDNTFDYTPALLQFVLSNPLVDVALVGMRDTETVEKNVAIANALDGRISLDELHRRYVGAEEG